MKYATIAVSVFVIGVIAFATVKKVSPVGWSWWGETNTSAGVTLHGHDPVACFVAMLPDGSLQQSKDNWARRQGVML